MTKQKKKLCIFSKNYKKNTAENEDEVKKVLTPRKRARSTRISSSEFFTPDMYPGKRRKLKNSTGLFGSYYKIVCFLFCLFSDLLRKNLSEKQKNIFFQFQVQFNFLC